MTITIFFNKDMHELAIEVQNYCNGAIIVIPYQLHFLTQSLTFFAVVTEGIPVPI